jgi:hypothetical protein
MRHRLLDHSPAHPDAAHQRPVAMDIAVLLASRVTESTYAIRIKVTGKEMAVVVTTRPNQPPIAANRSQQAAAASAAAAVLIKMVPESAANVKQALDAYLAGIENGEAKDRGIKLGEEMAGKVIELRARDGVDKVNTYRPVMHPGVYVQTMPTVGWEYSDMPPFAMTSPSQFRPPPPVALTSEQWAKDYNEIKDLGEKNSTRRTPRQTEGCTILDNRGSDDLSADPASDRDHQEHVGDRKCALHGGGGCRSIGCVDRRVRRQVQV